MGGMKIIPPVLKPLCTKAIPAIMGEMKKISPVLKPLCTKAIPAIMGEMRDFFEKVKKIRDNR